MANRFVSGGTIGSSGEEPKEASNEGSAATTSVRNTEWEAVQKELEADRQRREEQRRKAAEGEEKSLYDILQANKGRHPYYAVSPVVFFSCVLMMSRVAAKEAAFEEQTKVRNQFRALDDDEIDFLDEVRERKKKEEERVRRETEEGLQAFRERQKGGDAGEELQEQVGEAESWGVGRKRKRNKEKEVKGVRRRVSEGEGTKEGKKPEERSKDEKKADEKVEQPMPTSPPAKQKAGLALVDYGSDDSDD